MVTKQISNALLEELWIGTGKESFRIDWDTFGGHRKLPFGGIYTSKRVKRVQNPVLVGPPQRADNEHNSLVWGATRRSRTFDY